MKIPFAWILAPLAGLLEMVPTFGPWISGAFAVLVTLAVAPEKTLWVVALYGGIQLLENLIIVPRVQGGFLKINPAISVLLLVLGSYLAGLWGILLILPLAATIKELYLYTRSVLKESQTQALSVQPMSQDKNVAQEQQTANTKPAQDITNSNLGGKNSGSGPDINDRWVD
jgi:predicted PurR-regulated permease PerM